MILVREKVWAKGDWRRRDWSRRGWSKERLELGKIVAKIDWSRRGWSQKVVTGCKWRKQSEAVDQEQLEQGKVETR